MAACGAALRYAEQSTCRPLHHVRRLQRLHHGEFLVIDATCRRNLGVAAQQRITTPARDHCSPPSTAPAVLPAPVCSAIG